MSPDVAHLQLLYKASDEHNVDMRSDFLFATPSWLSGAARTLDLAGQFDDYNDSPTEEIADARALFLDWRAVGQALLDAVKVFRDEAVEAPTEESR